VVHGTTAGYTLDLAKYIASKSKKPGVPYTTVPGMIPDDYQSKCNAADTAVHSSLQQGID